MDGMGTALNNQELRTFPIQQERGAKPHPLKIPWAIAELAYSVYSAEYGTSQSLERLAERGGFGPSEMDIFLPDWRERCDENAKLKMRLAALESEVQKVQPPKGRASYLTVQQQFNLQHACRLLTASFGMCTYHVGSSLERPDWRDVDLRCILDDADYDAFIGKNQTKLRFLNVAISEWIGARTGLPIDFQFQRQTEANAEFEGRRNAVGFPLHEPIAPSV